MTAIQPFATDFNATDIEIGPDGNIWYMSFGTGAGATREAINKIRLLARGNGSPHAVARPTAPPEPRR